MVRVKTREQENLLEKTTDETPSLITVRPAVAADLEDIVRLDKNAWAAEDAIDSSHALRLWVDYAFVFVAVADGAPVGYVVAFPGTFCPGDSDGALFILHKIAVSPTHRRVGVGSLLIRGLVHTITYLFKKESHNVVKLRLTMRPGNIAAERLYMKEGFAIFWTEKNYYGPGEDRQIVQKDI